MNAQLLYLAYLVSIKNDLNRKRRRFYCMMADMYDYKEKKPEHKLFTKAYVTDMYKQTQREMREMTPLMRQVRKEAGAYLIWGSGGQILGIENSEQHYYFDLYHSHGNAARNISELIEMYHVDTILLADK